MNKLKACVVVFILIYPVVGFLLLMHYGGQSCTIKAMNYGVVEYRWLNTTEAYLKWPHIYIMGTKIAYPGSVSSTFYAKHDLTTKITGKIQYDKIIEITNDEYNQSKTSANVFAVIDYSDYETTKGGGIQNTTKCGNDKLYDKYGDLVFVNGNQKKMVDKYAYIQSSLYESQKNYYNDCKLTTYSFSPYLLSKTRDASTYPMLILNIAVGIVADFFQLPFLLLIAPFARGL